MEISKMTVKELKEFIRVQTRETNTKLQEIYKRDNITSAIKTEIDVMKNKGIISNRTGKAILEFKNKNKYLLQQQARELDYFSNWTGKETKVFREMKDYEKYKSFKENNKEFENYTYQQWRDVVEVLGTMSSEIEQFGYNSEDVIQLHKEITAKDISVNLVKEIHDVLEENKSATQEEIVDLLRLRVFGKKG